MKPFLYCLMVFLNTAHAYGSAEKVTDEEESPLIQTKTYQLQYDAYEFTLISGCEKISFLKALPAISLSVTSTSKIPLNLCSMEEDSLKAVMIDNPSALNVTGCSYVFSHVESLFLTKVKSARNLSNILRLFPHLEELIFASPILSGFSHQEGALEKYIKEHLQAVKHYITSCRDPERPLKTIVFPQSIATQAYFLEAMTQEPLSHFSLRSRTRPCPTASRTYEFLYIFDRHTFKTYTNDSCEGCVLF